MAILEPDIFLTQGLIITLNIYIYIFFIMFRYI